MKIFFKFMFLFGALLVLGGCDASATYEVYAPEVTLGYVYNPEGGQLRYNHDSSICYYRGRFYAAWNGNANSWEGREGQKNYWAVSDDGLNWSQEKEFENVPEFGSPKWQTQWQPNLCNPKRKSPQLRWLSFRWIAKDLTEMSRQLF